MCFTMSRKLHAKLFKRISRKNCVLLGLLLLGITLCLNNVCNKKIIEAEPWFTVYHKDMSELQPTIPKNLKLFSLAMNKSELGVIMKLLEVFTQTMDKHNLTYVIDGGSLLGTYRHHGPIPWDDDFDVLVNIDQRDNISNALETLSPEYVVYKSGNFRDHRWKMYSKEDSKQNYKTKKWNWPFLDIFWYKDNGSHIHDIFKRNDLKIHDFYPLRRRPFGYLNVYAPCNVSAKLKVNKIDWNMCVTSKFNHRKEVWVKEKQISIPCNKLHKYFPFVFRFNTEGVSIEYLKANNKFVSSYKEHPCK